MESIRLVQLADATGHRRVARVDEPCLYFLTDTTSVYQLALDAIAADKSLNVLIQERQSNDAIPYDAVYDGTADWHLLPAFDHPGNPLCCMVTGTGLTHKNSALNRQMMHGDTVTTPTDSMRMYQWGLEGGSPGPGQIGVQPEWFYKGNGAVLRAHGESLVVPAYGNDGGEEPEVAGVYIVSADGQPCRIGFCTGNEFSDHVMEKKNYLYLAPSKIRQCAIGPELVITDDFSGVAGTVSVKRGEATIWSSPVQTGETTMAHNLQNLEYHQFKYASHRVPRQAHVHFFGADAFSFGNGIRLEPGDTMAVHWQGMGRPLVNPLATEQTAEALIPVRAL